EALSFKKFEKDHKKTDRVRSHQMSLDRVTSASAATLRGQGWLPGADAKEAVLPSEIGVKRRADEQEGEVELKGRGKGQEKGGDKGKGKGKMTVKDGI
ncbi:mok14, partial [Symbiodinium necroappetens]